MDVDLDLDLFLFFGVVFVMTSSCFPGDIVSAGVFNWLFDWDEADNTFILVKLEKGVGIIGFSGVSMILTFLELFEEIIFKLLFEFSKNHYLPQV